MVLISIGVVGILFTIILLILSQYSSKGALSTGVPDGTLAFAVAGIICISVLTGGIALVEYKYNQFTTELEKKVEEKKEIEEFNVVCCHYQKSGDEKLGLLKNKKVILFSCVLLVLLFLISGCSNKEEKTKELIFVEKISGSYMNYIIFESEEDQKYYYVSVNGWEYDNLEKFFDAEEGERVELKTKPYGKIKSKLALSTSSERVKLFDEYKVLRIDKYYKKTNKKSKTTR